MIMVSNWNTQLYPTQIEVPPTGNPPEPADSAVPYSTYALLVINWVTAFLNTLWDKSKVCRGKLLIWATFLDQAFWYLSSLHEEYEYVIIILIQGCSW